jgi:hypothetical protein
MVAGPEVQTISNRERPVAISAVPPSVNFQPASQLLAQVGGQHRHRGQHSSLSDVDAQGGNPTPAPNPTGKVGSLLDVTA